MSDRSTAREMGILIFIMLMLAQGTIWVVSRFWRELICLFIAGYLLDYTMAHFFSPMTRDLSKEIAQQHKAIKVVGFPVLKYHDADFNAREPAQSWYQDTHFDDFSVSLKNTSQGRLTDATLVCHGHTTKLPPSDKTDGNNQPYAAVQADYTMTRKLYTMMIDPGATKDVVVANYRQGMPPFFESDRKNLTCEITEASFVEGDFYRAAHEMDRYSTATLDDHLVSRASVKPVTYGGWDYPIYLSGPIKNVGSSSVSQISVTCEYGFDGPTDHDFMNISKKFAVNIGAGQTIGFSDKVVMDNNPINRKPISSTCHIDGVR